VTESLDNYLLSRRESYLVELQRFIRIPSVSSQPHYREELDHCARFVADLLRSAGIEHVTLLETGGYPIVYGDWLHAPGRPTVLIYGHYDVQPPEPLEAWNSPPFEPVIKNGKLFGRGCQRQ
jgi:acetylornithine deacetylase/succinyl-diaminopimelate desuccinylase-like protein